MGLQNLPDNNRHSELNDIEQQKIDQLRSLLNEHSIDYTIFSHEKTVITAEEGAEKGMGSLDEMAPTLVLKTENGAIVAIISGSTRLSYKKIKKELKLKNVSLATPDYALELTGSKVGTISLVNPEFTTIIDSKLKSIKAVYGGCGIDKHTLKINVDDLIKINGANVFDFTENK